MGGKGQWDIAVEIAVPTDLAPSSISVNKRKMGKPGISSHIKKKKKHGWPKLPYEH